MKLVRLAALAIATAAATPAAVAAQTDYYNTDARRPIRIEDAYPVERRAFEVQLAPLRLERSRGGRYQWGIEPELAYGILPRTHIEIGAPVAYVDAGGDSRRAGLAGVDVGLLYNLNTETAIPAFAIAVNGLLPVGNLGPERAYGTIKGIMTRTFRWARFHANGEYTLGEVDTPAGGGSPPDPSVDGGVAELSRWMAGIAVDRTFPLEALLVTAEVYAERPLGGDEELRWITGVGARYQLSPRFNIDGGIGRRFTGPDQSWHLTFGAAVAVGLPWNP